jgi:hypothetical protein
MKTKGKQRETKGNKGKRRETQGNKRKHRETEENKGTLTIKCAGTVGGIRWRKL